LLEGLTAVIEDEYNQEHQRIARSPEQRRVELVRRLLNCEPVGDSELADLRYRFDARHIGVIATGNNARDALESLTAGRQFLCVPAGEEIVWGWLGGQQQLSHTDIERRCSLAEPGVLLAFGELASGIEGWRETHQQAQHALRVAVLTQRSPIRYADMALLAPWLEDPERGRALMELYLSPLDRQRDRGTISFQTLHAYHEAGWNVASAARKLGIERRTLAYRLSRIEESLGYKLDTRKAELEVALRLHGLQKR
jgi:DNA-binding PucR family transcriptional regulator